MFVIFKNVQPLTMSFSRCISKIRDISVDVNSIEDIIYSSEEYGNRAIISVKLGSDIKNFLLLESIEETTEIININKYRYININE